MGFISVRMSLPLYAVRFLKSNAVKIVILLADLYNGTGWQISEVTYIREKHRNPERSLE